MKLHFHKHATVYRQGGFCFWPMPTIRIFCIPDYFQIDFSWLFFTYHINSVIHWKDAKGEGR